MSRKLSHIPPMPLHILYACPESLVEDLEAALYPLEKRSVVVSDNVQANALSKRLNKDGRFHLLVISVTDFGLLSPKKQTLFGSRVNLLVFISDKVKRPLSETVQGISPAVLIVDSEKAVDFLYHLCVGLTEGQELETAVTHTQSQLSEMPPPTLYFARPDHAVWPLPPGKTQQPPPTSRSQMSSTFSTQIHNANIGQFIQAQGDTININPSPSQKSETDPSMRRNPPQQTQMSYLYQLLVQLFNESELHQLCFELGVDYDMLDGTNKGDKSRTFLTYLERRQQLDKLIKIGKKLRPKVSWQVA